MLTATGALVATVWQPDALAALALIPAWCWFVIGVPIASVAWRTGLPRTAALLAAFWLVFALSAVDEVPSLARQTLRGFWKEPPPDDALRIVSLNAAGDERCVADLKAASPDIVLLQEAPGGDALQRVAAALFGDTGEYCTAGDVAILARGHIASHQADERGTYTRAEVHLGGGQVVECLSLRLAPPAARIDPWTLEFWKEHSERRQLHRQQIADAMAAIKGRPHDAPIIIGGDFNTLPGDRALARIQREYTDTFAACGVGWGATGTNDWPLFRVDQIWTSDRLVPWQAFARRTDHSDHRMVICDVVVRR